MIWPGNKWDRLRRNLLELLAACLQKLVNECFLIYLQGDLAENLVGIFGIFSDPQNIGLSLVARAIRNAIRTNRFARIIRN